MYLLSKLLGPGQTLADIGANVGLYSLVAVRLVGADGKVLAFEPSPRNATSFNVTSTATGSAKLL